MSTIIGQQINQYRLDKVLGEGGMGHVYLAWDVNLDRNVAIKLMHAQLAAQSEFRQRLTQEAKTAAGLEHPSIVRVYDFGDSEHGLFIAMEYISGGTLRNLIRTVRQKRRYIQTDQIIQIGVHIAEALGYAHRSGAVHRDVKPGNIILKQLVQPEMPAGALFRAMLSDFGLVKVSESSLKTQTGFTMGTPIYMSPEQCHGADLDGRSDIYSLGVVLYELVTGEPPFAFKSLANALSTHMKAIMPSVPSSKRSEVPLVLDTILMRMLAKEPEDRYQSAFDVAEVLRSALGSLEDNPTRAIPKVSRPTSDPELAAEDNLPVGYSLMMRLGEKEPEQIDLKQEVVTIGRSAQNDVVLPLEGVSRFNSKVQATEAGWELIDLGGFNGTFFNDERLVPNQAVLLQPGDKFEIENCTFTVGTTDAFDGSHLSSNPEPIISELLRTSVPMEVPKTVVEDEPSSKQSNPELKRAQDQLSLMLTREKYQIQAGHTANIVFEVLNRSQDLARVNVRVMGIPSDWVQQPEEFVEIPARSSNSVPLKIRVPRSAKTPVGSQRVRVSLFSPQYPDLKMAASLKLDLVGFHDFRAEMEPKQVTLPDSVTVTLKNSGNLPGKYAIQLGPQDKRLQISKVIDTITLPAGESIAVDVPLQSSQIRFFGDRIEDHFDLYVIDVDNEVRNKVFGGRATLRPVLSRMTTGIIVTVITVVLLFACATSTSRAINQSFTRLLERFPIFSRESSSNQFEDLSIQSDFDQELVFQISEAEATVQTVKNRSINKDVTQHNMSNTIVNALLDAGRPTEG